ADGTWRRLDEVRTGDRVHLAAGTDLWATEPVRIDWRPETRLTLAAVAAEAGVDIETVIRYRRGVRGRHSAKLADPVARYEVELARRGLTQTRRNPIRVPEVVDEGLAAFLGYLTGDGHISACKRTMGLTTGDE